MSVTTLKTIWCDVCDVHEDIDSGNMSVSEYRKSVGWIHAAGKDICPTCVKNIESKLAHELKGIPSNVLEFVLETMRKE